MNWTKKELRLYVGAQIAELMAKQLEKKVIKKLRKEVITMACKKCAKAKAAPKKVAAKKPCKKCKK